MQASHTVISSVSSSVAGLGASCRNCSGQFQMINSKLVGVTYRAIQGRFWYLHGRAGRRPPWGRGGGLHPDQTTWTTVTGHGSLTDKADDVDCRMQPLQRAGILKSQLHISANNRRIEEQNDYDEDIEALSVDQPAGHYAGRLEPRVHNLHTVSASFSRCYSLPRLSTLAHTKTVTSSNEWLTVTLLIDLTVANTMSSAKLIHCYSFKLISAFFINENTDQKLQMACSLPAMHDSWNKWPWRSPDHRQRLQIKYETRSSSSVPASGRCDEINKRYRPIARSKAHTIHRNRKTLCLKNQLIRLRTLGKRLAWPHSEQN